MFRALVPLNKLYCCKCVGMWRRLIRTHILQLRPVVTAIHDEKPPSKYIEKSVIYVKNERVDRYIFWNLAS